MYFDRTLEDNIEDGYPLRVDAQSGTKRVLRGNESYLETTDQWFG